MIGVAFDVNDLGLRVLRTVSEAVHDQPAAHRAVRTGVARLGCAQQLKLADFGEHRCRREAERRNARAADAGRADLEELAPGQFDVHGWGAPPKDAHGRLIRPTHRTRSIYLIMLSRGSPDFLEEAGNIHSKSPQRG